MTKTKLAIRLYLKLLAGLSPRLHNQAILCALRDYLAREYDRDPEEIQTTCEAFAVLNKRMQL